MLQPVWTMNTSNRAELQYPGPSCVYVAAVFIGKTLVSPVRPLGLSKCLLLWFCALAAHLTARASHLPLTTLHRRP